jgi:hypothetical protein
MTCLFPFCALLAVSESNSLLFSVSVVGTDDCGAVLSLLYIFKIEYVLIDGISEKLNGLKLAPKKVMN